MSQHNKLMAQILSGARDSNISFTGLRGLLDSLGFICRSKGDHFIYTKDGVEEIINLQPIGDKAKAYQVRQVRNLILKYNLGGEIDEV